jgi:hypothetical protein
VAGFSEHHTAEVALVGKSAVGSNAREIALAARQALQRIAGAESHPVARERHAGHRSEDPAEMMGETKRALARCDGPYTHHNGSAQVFAEEHGRTRLVWTTDLPPNDLAAGTAERMERGISVIRDALEAAASRA